MGRSHTLVAIFENFSPCLEMTLLLWLAVVAVVCIIAALPRSVDAARWEEPRHSTRTECIPIGQDRAKADAMPSVRTPGTALCPAILGNKDKGRGSVGGREAAEQGERSTHHPSPPTAPTARTVLRGASS